MNIYNRVGGILYIYAIFPYHIFMGILFAYDNVIS